MTTISVPLNNTLATALDELASKTGASRAVVMRRALERLAEEEAVNAVLLAQREPTLSGDVRDLLKRVR